MKERQRELLLVFGRLESAFRRRNFGKRERERGMGSICGAFTRGHDFHLTILFQYASYFDSDRSCLGYETKEIDLYNIKMIFVIVNNNQRDLHVFTKKKKETYMLNII